VSSKERHPDKDNSIMTIDGTNTPLETTHRESTNIQKGSCQLDERTETPLERAVFEKQGSNVSFAAKEEKDNDDLLGILTDRHKSLITDEQKSMMLEDK